MSSVDNRIVQMQFDNAKFENGVSTSINSIDKLKQALQFNDAGKGFDNITKAASSVDLSAVQNGIESIEQKFSIVSEAIRRNVGKVIDELIGKATQLANALFVAPRTDGFEEYELKMGSVQTIMASTGATLEEVNSYLDELNTYADKTIYSFSDMTANIGKFTNAGVKLDVAVKAIQGISNEAAISGANSAEASRAMYNFAQALSAGAVKLIDWKSIENANMATVEFKQELLDTAVALGTVVKDGDKYRSVTTDLSGKVSEAFTATSMFNESLSHQWLTTDVLTTTLGRYADASTELGKKAFAAAQDVKTWSQLLDTLKEAMGSGWAQSFEILIGDFNEAKELFTMISNTLGGIIDKSAKVRNGFLKMWDDKGGREKLIKQLEIILGQIDILSDKVLKNLLGSKYNKILGETNDILDDTTKKVDNLTEAEKKFVEEVWLQGLHGTGEQRAKEAEELGLNYERIQNALDKIVTGETTVDSLAETTAESTEKTADAIEEIKDSKWSDAFGNALTTVKFLGKALLNIGETILNIGKLFVQAFVEEFAIDDVTYGIKNFARYLMQATGRIKDWSKDSSGILTIFRGIFKFANALWRVLSPFLTFAGKAIRQIANWLVEIGEAIDQWTKKIDENSRLYRAWTAIKTIAGKVKDAFLDMFNQLGEAAETNPKIKKLRDFFSDIADRVRDIFDSGFTKFVEFLERIADGDISFDNIKEMVSNFGKGESKIGGFFDKFKDGFGSFDKFNDIWSKVKEKLSFEELSTVGTKAFIWSRNLAAGVVAGLKTIDWDRVVNVVKFGAFLYISWQTISILNSIKTITKGFNKAGLDILSKISGILSAFQAKIAAEALKTAAISIAILAGSLITLSMVPSDKLKSVADSISLVILSLALLASLLKKSLISVSKENKYIKINTTLLGIAAILAVMASIFKFVSTEKGDFGKALGIMGGFLGELLGFILVLSLINRLAGTQAPTLMRSLKKLAGAILIMGIVVSGLAIVAKEVGSDAINDATQALFGIMILMSAMSALVLVPGIDRLPIISAGLILMALAIGVVTPALLALALIPSGGLWKAVGAVTALFTILGLVSRVIRGNSLIKFGIGMFAIAAACAYAGKHFLTVVPGILALAGAIVVLGVAGGIMGIFAGAIAAGAVAIKAVAIAALIGSAAFLIFAISIKLIADSLPRLADGLIYLAQEIDKNAPAIATAIGVVIMSIVDALDKSSTKIFKYISKFLVSLSEFLIDPSHGLVGVLLDVLEALVSMLGRIIGRLADIIIVFIVELLTSVSDAINQRSGEIGSAIEYFVASLVNLLTSLLGSVIDGVVKGLVGVDLGLSDKLNKEITKGEAKFVAGSAKKLGDGNAFKEFRNSGEKTGTAAGNAYGSGVGSAFNDTLNENIDKYMDPQSMFDSIGGQQVGPLPFNVPLDMSVMPSFNGSDIKNAFDKMGDIAGGSYSEGIFSGLSDYPIDLSSYNGNFDQEELFNQMGYFNGETFGEGSILGIDSVDTEGFLDDYVDGFHMPNEYEQAGDDDAQSFVKGIEDNKPTIRRKAIQAAAGAVEVFEEKKIDFFTAGLHAMDGFVEGVQHKMDQVYAVSLEAANRVKEAFSGKKGLDEHSPSKVFMTYGEYASEGFIVGLTSYSDKVSDSSSAVANSAIDALKTPLSHITDILNGNLVVDPTIRPVLDLTELQNGTGMINDLFANRSVQLAGATAKLNDFNNTMIFDAKKNQNRDVVDEMRSLRSDVNALADKMDTLQVVMDSGQLVGAISSPMDAALGQRAIRKGRRN